MVRLLCIDGRTGDKFDRSSNRWLYVHAETEPFRLMTKCMLVLRVHTVLLRSSHLGGKAQFGGQRFGEMEVLGTSEAYGAAYTLARNANR